jgi:hypothetical protein
LWGSWRFTFKRLAAEAQDGLRADDAGPAASALEQLIDLVCDTRDYDYFGSEDPLAAAGFVVSDVAAVLRTRGNASPSSTYRRWTGYRGHRSAKPAVPTNGRRRSRNDTVCCWKTW